MRDHLGSLRAFAVHLCGDRDLADDLVSECFAEAWRSLGSLRDESRARAWLAQILRHRFAHWRRRQGRRISTTTLEGDVGPATGDDVLHRLAQREGLERALATLSEELRETFLTVFLAGLTCQEAADLLGVPRGTVLSRLHRARQQLRRALTPAETPAVEGKP